MRELLRTTDQVLTSAVESLLIDTGIPHQILDRDISVISGSIKAFPNRNLVADDNLPEARQLLKDAGLDRELPPDRR